MNKDEILYEKAINKYGEKTQIIILLEEFSELQKELIKFLRGGGDIRAISEEIADVEIMLGQVQHIFKNKNYITKIKQEKIKRLEHRLSEL